MKQRLAHQVPCGLSCETIHAIAQASGSSGSGFGRRFLWGCRGVALVLCFSIGAAAAGTPHPIKGDQDKLDAVICLLVAIRWRLRPRTDSVMLGDLGTGYMVIPASAEVRAYLMKVARLKGVPIDGSVPV